MEVKEGVGEGAGGPASKDEGVLKKWLYRLGLVTEKACRKGC